MKTKPYHCLRNVGRTYRQGQCGAAAAEFALVLSLLAIPILNVVDVGIYVYGRMELDNSAQAAVQRAWSLCAVTGKVPAIGNCTGVSGAMAAAAQNTPLGTSVTITSTSEQYCCPGVTLSCQGPVGTTTPTNCTSGAAPGDYIFATASYSYTPLFAGVSVASLLTTPIVRTASMRLS
ncbi:MAG: pilus assembly protein [Alphaproteobacteria bacterium]|nr:pilus assembly protein [Alphaproteobacteria bacterium]